MKALSVLAGIAAFATFASAHFVTTNGTHFIDEETGKTIKHFGCPVHRGMASQHFNETIAKMHKNKDHKHSKGGSRIPRSRRQMVQTPIAVNAYFHVISMENDSSTVTQTMVNTSFTVNDDWAVAADDTTMNDLKTALRIGTYQDMNLYFHTDLAGGDLGTCTLPSQVPAGSAPSVYVSDGCNINAHTMPGGSMGGYNLGKTAVHEAGHWFGLLHTFEGYSCTGDGDFINDTPFEMQSTDGCPSKPPKDSCPSETGVDPIHNYMDYSTDACYTQFTPDQVARMDQMWTQYRQGM